LHDCSYMIMLISSACRHVQVLSPFTSLAWLAPSSFLQHAALFRLRKQSCSDCRCAHTFITAQGPGAYPLMTSALHSAREREITMLQPANKCDNMLNKTKDTLAFAAGIGDESTPRQPTCSSCTMSTLLEAKCAACG